MEKIEVPKPKRAGREFSESMRSPNWWLGFLYGVVLIIGTRLLLGREYSGFLTTPILAISYGIIVARSVVEVRNRKTLRACITGAAFTSIRSIFYFVLSPPTDFLSVIVPLLWDWFLGAFIGYWYIKSPRKIGKGAIIGGIVGGLAIFLVTTLPNGLLTEGLLSVERLKAAIFGIICGGYGGSFLCASLVQMEATKKTKEIEESQLKPLPPSNLSSSLTIIPMRTSMLTYKGTGVVRFGALELKVNRDQYTTLKLGLTYRIEYGEHNMTLLGFELVSKETPVLSQRIQE